MADANAPHFSHNRLTGQVSGMAGMGETKGYTRRSLTYEDYMEMLSILNDLESVVGIRQISDYMNALKVAQRSSTLAIDPANVLLSMGKLYAEKEVGSWNMPRPPNTENTDGAWNNKTLNVLAPHGERPPPLYFTERDEKVKHAGTALQQNIALLKGLGSDQNTRQTSGSTPCLPDPMTGARTVPVHLLRSHLERTHGAPLASVVKQITNASYLLRFNVTNDLGKLLSNGNEDHPAMLPSLLRDSSRSLFKRNISIIDESGHFFTVKYEGIMSSKQRHNRLTTGWSTVIKSLGIVIGDSITFEKWTSNNSIIHVSVSRAKRNTQDSEKYEENVKRLRTIASSTLGPHQQLYSYVQEQC